MNNSQITNISTSVLKVHPRNTEFFDDIEGDNYIQFKKSIEEEGIITPLIVSSDMTIISGHQRYKAAKDLGITQVPVIIREDLEDEDEKLKKLLATNFGRMKNDPNKQRKVAVQYVELCGLKQGQRTNDKSYGKHKTVMTQSEIAKQLGVSVPTLNEMLAIERKLTPEIKDLIDEGVITKSSAFRIWTKLSETEQEELLQELGKDKIKAMTIKETEQYIEKAKGLEVAYNDLSQKYKQEQNKTTKVVEVDKTDYKAMEKLKKELESKSNLYRIAKEKEELYKKQLDLYEIDSQKYKDLTRQIELLTKEKDDMGRVVKSATELSGYIYKIETFLKDELAPIKYSRSLIDCKNNKVVMENISQIVNVVQDWCNDISQYLSLEQQNIINVEVEE